MFGVALRVVLAWPVLACAALSATLACAGCWYDDGNVGAVAKRAQQAQCSSDDDCAQGQRCSDAGMCVACTDGECEQADAAVASCGANDAQCPQCRIDDDCGDDAECEDGTCQPAEDEEEDIGESADDGDQAGAGSGSDSGGQSGEDDGEPVPEPER